MFQSMKLVRSVFRQRRDLFSRNFSAQAAGAGNTLKFHHFQLYTDKLETLEEYKKLEKQLNDFSGILQDGEAGKLKSQGWCAEHGRNKWDGKTSEFSPAGRDVVKQMIHSAGWRIAAYHDVRYKKFLRLEFALCYFYLPVSELTLPQQP